MVGFGVLFCFCYLFYLLFYAPLVRGVHEKSLQLVEKQETLIWMRQVRQRHQVTKAPEVLSNAQLLTLLATQLQTTSFQRFPYQLQQTGVGDIQLSFEQVPFNSFITWLWTINQKYAISIKQFSAERTDSPGIVKMLIVLAAK